MRLNIYRRIKKNTFDTTYNRSPLSTPHASYLPFHGQGDGYSTSWGNRRQGAGDRRQGAGDRRQGAGDSRQMQGAMGSPGQAGGVRQGGSGFFPSSAASAEFPAAVKPEQRQSRAGLPLLLQYPFSCITPLLFLALSPAASLPLLLFALFSYITPFSCIPNFSYITPSSCTTSFSCRV